MKIEVKWYAEFITVSNWSLIPETLFKRLERKGEDDEFKTLTRGYVEFANLREAKKYLIGEMSRLKSELTLAMGEVRSTNGIFK